MKKIRKTISKYYKIVASSFSVVISTLGFALSFLGFKYDENENKILFFVLIIAELFLIVTTIYSVVSAFKNIFDKASFEAKNREIELRNDAMRIILENNKSILTTYKDFNDKLKTISDNYIESNIKLKELFDKTEESQGYIELEKNNSHIRLRDSLIDSYKRFLSSTTNLLKQNIEKYLLTKGHNESVSIAIKQLSTPTAYTEINDSNVDVFTAFRDSKTYNSKKRNETWKKRFKITRNSDFVMSVEKDYYIFNFMNRRFLEDGLYQNENEAFYEDYNSGVTCTIYSCVNGKRILYGYIACDSLFQLNNENSDKSIYDWNVANMMMNTAHVIAMYLEHFTKIWNELYVGYEKNFELWKELDFSKFKRVCLPNNTKEKSNEYGFCETMQEIVKGTRYNR